MLGSGFRVGMLGSGCGTTIKDYGFMFRDDPAYAEKAARVSAIAKDVTEYMAEIAEASVIPLDTRPGTSTASTTTASTAFTDSRNSPPPAKSKRHAQPAAAHSEHRLSSPALSGRLIAAEGAAMRVIDSMCFSAPLGFCVHSAWLATCSVRSRAPATRRTRRSDRLG